MAQGESEAINRMGPQLSSSGSIYASQATAYTAASSAFIAIPGMGAGTLGSGGRVWVTLMPLGAATPDVHLAFGDAAMGAATTSDARFLSGQREDFEVPPGCTGFRMIGNTSAGILYWHRSG